MSERTFRLLLAAFVGLAIGVATTVLVLSIHPSVLTYP